MSLYTVHILRLQLQDNRVFIKSILVPLNTVPDTSSMIITVHKAVQNVLDSVHILRLLLLDNRVFIKSILVPLNTVPDTSSMIITVHKAV